MVLPKCDDPSCRIGERGMRDDELIGKTIFIARGAPNGKFLAESEFRIIGNNWSKTEYRIAEYNFVVKLPDYGKSRTPAPE